jgi:hypothetical protein
MALYPFILLRHAGLKENTVLINHEKIHLRQQAELVIIPFYIWYFTEYLIRLLQYRDHKKAYLNISFEKEAYQHEFTLNYLATRNIWDFMKHL